MDLPKNAFKAAITEGRQQIGLWCSIPDPTTIEMLAGCGFDWLMIDTEHTAMSTGDVLALLQAVAPYPVTPIVRPSSLNPPEIKRLLDCGIQTLLIPYVQNAEEAYLAAAAVAYPPAGIRGVAGITRASRFGAIPDYHRHAREEICLIVQIETLDALGKLEEIAAVPGIDAIFIGPADLAASMGYPGEPSHPAVKTAVLDAIKRVRAAGLPAGILTLDQLFLEDVIEGGSVFTAVDVDAAILGRGALAQAGKWNTRKG
ncbi:4-hydroxy-2-oxo-heptane-1,7-dioate aldolase [Stappia sp. F7233]|uniref:4-hydroxy-2-oxo-heptane-1,7-dioate aldolase n=1 Tax=Stappia albiluteola TaxID=2758565 RepID=A0A839A959_9HYPH|nr:aldolase/citrate lyase family protein [Stappia albiluteola]MBA5775871.1 4-hydroxy-2-oxo-heptane-1,7-dioate aldolase [Stappia albiluteola]